MKLSEREVVYNIVYIYIFTVSYILQGIQSNIKRGCKNILASFVKIE